MRTTFVLIATMLAATPAMAVQDDRLSQSEQDADRIEAQRIYEAQRRRDQAEADRVAKTNLDRQADYDLYLARQKAEHEARMAQWRADVARQKAEHEAAVAKCVAEKKCAPR